MLPDTPPAFDHPSGNDPSGHDPSGDDPSVDPGNGARRPRPAPDGIAALPAGPAADDDIAGLYAWPDAGRSPVVRANMIASLDGGSTIDGRTAKLGNSADEQLFALLRDLADVVLVGAGTVRAEGYGGIRLDAARQARRRRWGLPVTPPPIAVVTNGGLDPDLPLFRDTETPPIVITSEQGSRAVPDGIPVVVAGIDRVNLSAAIGSLAAGGMRRIHCEGGPALLGSLIADGLLDECCLTIAPFLLGSAALPLLPVAMAERVRWELLGARVSGDYLFTRWASAGAR